MPRLLESRHFSILVSFLFLIPSLVQANFRFAAPFVSYETGQYSISLVAADLNGDGHVDVATADADDNTISIFLGQGDGSLAQRTAFAVPAYPNCVRAGDLDQNGTQDLVVACLNANQVSILWGAGDGTFPNRTDLTATGTPLSVAVGDLEGSDPYPDFAVATNTGTIWVFRNTGGIIGAPSSMGIGQTAWAIVIDDMNLDGHNDIIVSGYYEGKVSVFPGTGNANFSPRIMTNVRWPRAVITADINGDAYPDVLAAADTAFVTLLGNGDGTFSSTPPLDYVYTEALTAGDFNRDGKIDVAVNADGLGGYLSVFNGKGDGTYAGRKQYDGPGGNELLTADLDEDGRLDLLGVDSDYPGLHAIRGYGDGTFGLGRSYEMGTAPAEVRAGDLNNDGRPDLVIVQRSYAGGFAVRLGELGGFGPKVEYPGLGQHNTAQFGDINGDGDQDIILGSEANSIAVYLGNGDGTFGDAVGYFTWTGPISLAVGDLNQDGYDDVVSGNSNLASVWLGHADGTLEWTEDYPAGPPVLLGDYNEDGKLDLVGPKNAQSIWFFPGNGDGTFGDAVESYHFVLTTRMGAGDLNEDGHVDLVAAWYGGDVVTLLGDGQGNFQEAQYTYFTRAGLQQMDLADLDLDGHLDVCFGDSWTGTFLCHGNGDGTLVHTQSVGIGRPVNGVGIADFDQSGAPDIAVSGSSLHQDKGRAVILYNLINAQVAVAPPAEAPRNPMRLLANPGRGRLSIQINLTTAEHVRMEVLDLSGRRVAVPMDSMLPGGEHTISWRGESTGGRPATPGVYVIRMVAGGKARAMKAVWLRN